MKCPRVSGRVTTAMNHSEDVTQLLGLLAKGDRRALDQVFPLVYNTLRKIAHHQMHGERGDHTLCATALVHEAYFKLAALDRFAWQNRTHFLAIAAQAMRNILVDYALQKKAQKRGGNWSRVPLDEAMAMTEGQAEQVLALDQALNGLQEFDDRSARVVEYRFFAGLSIQETAEMLGVSCETVSRDWALARAWLNRALVSNEPRGR